MASFSAEKISLEDTADDVGHTLRRLRRQKNNRKRSGKRSSNRRPSMDPMTMYSVFGGTPSALLKATEMFVLATNVVIAMCLVFA